MKKSSIQTGIAKLRNPKIGLPVAAILTALIGFIVYNSLAAGTPSIVAPRSGVSVAGKLVVNTTLPGGTKSNTGKLLIDNVSQPGTLTWTPYGYFYKAPDGTYGVNMASYGVGIHTLTAVFGTSKSAPILVNNTTQVKIAYPNVASANYGQRVLVAGTVQTPQPPTNVKLEVDGVQQLGTVQPTPYGWIYQHTDGNWGVPLSVGTHSLVLVANGVRSDPLTIPVVSQLRLAFVSPVNNATKQPSVLTFDAAIDNPVLRPQLQVDGQILPGAMIPTIYGWLYQAPNGSLTVTLSNGTHTAKIINGNVSSQQISFTVGNLGSQSIPAPTQPPAPSSNTPKGFGIAEPPWYIYENGGLTAYQQRLTLIQQLHATWIRVDFPADRIGNTEMNNIYNEATARGIKIMAVANAGFPTDTAGWVRNMLSHYPKIGALEIGNEENLFGSAGTPNYSPSKYVGYLQAAYDAKQQVNPSVPVVIGGIAAYGTNDPHNPNNYFDGILSAAQSYKSNHGHFPWDGIGIHPYEDSIAPLNGGTYYGSGLAISLHNKAVAKGDAGIIWSSEYGYSTQGHGASSNLTTAAQWLGDFGNWWKQQSWTGPFMYFNLDTPTNQTGREAGFGLISPTNGNPAGAAKRPAFTAFQTMAQ